MNKKTSFQNQLTDCPLLLLHGFAEDSRVWAHLLPEWKRDYAVFTPDLPGSGATAFLKSPSVEEMAAAVIAFMDQAGIQQAVVVGHSMGGYVTLALMEHYANRLAAAGLFCSHPLADDAAKKLQRDRTVALLKQKGRAHFIQQFIPALFAPANVPRLTKEIETLQSQQSSQHADGLIWQLQAMRDRPDRQYVLANWEKPFLLAAGKEDPLVPISLVYEWAMQVSITQLAVVNGAGHMLHFEKPEKTIAILDEFMKFTLTK